MIIVNLSALQSVREQMELFWKVYGDGEAKDPWQWEVYGLGSILEVL